MKKYFLPLAVLIFTYITLFVSCKKNNEILNCKNLNGQVQVINYSFDSDDNSGLMFQDYEPKDSILSRWRAFKIGMVLRVKPVDNKVIEIANFAPMDLYDASIFMVIKSKGDTINLFNIPKIRAHGVQRIEYPFVSGDAVEFNKTNGESMNLSEFSYEGISKNDVEFFFDGNNETLIKLKKLSKLNWEIYFQDRNPDDRLEKWTRLDVWPIDARRYTAYMINMGSMFTWEPFKEQFLNTPQSYGDGTFFTLQNKMDVYEDLINKERYKIGVTRRAGMAGGQRFALGQGQLHSFINSGMTSVGAHETGHMLGFGHNSSMTYAKKLPDGTLYGIEIVVRGLLKTARKENVFPVTIDNYYNPGDFDQKITTNLPYPY